MMWIVFGIPRGKKTSKSLDKHPARLTNKLYLERKLWAHVFKCLDQWVCPHTRDKDSNFWKKYVLMVTKCDLPAGYKCTFPPGRVTSAISCALEIEFQSKLVSKLLAILKQRGRLCTRDTNNVLQRNEGLPRSSLIVSSFDCFTLAFLSHSTLPLLEQAQGTRTVVFTALTLTPRGPIKHAHMWWSRSRPCMHMRPRHTWWQ